MRIVIFGLSISSSWGNGHATVWRGLIKGLIRRNHDVTFFERDVPYYAGNRDFTSMDGMELLLYRTWESVRTEAERRVRGADVAIVTSYCPDGVAAGALVCASRVPRRVFYDLDTPVTLKMIEAGHWPDYIGRDGLGGFDMVLSFTGGESLDLLRSVLGARRTAPLYGSVDPETHAPAEPLEHYRGDLSYLGTYAPDRQSKLRALFLLPARECGERRFVLGGAQYPATLERSGNVVRIEHVSPPEHAAFYCSSRFTLNITRQAMTERGFCPSGRLFEAAACGVPIISDWWPGLDSFFAPGREIVIVHTTEEVVDTLGMAEQDRAAIGRAARARALGAHTGDHRAAELERLLAYE